MLQSATEDLNGSDVAARTALRVESGVPDPARPLRDSALDNLKAALVAGVIVGHASMTYGSIGTWILEVPSYGGRSLSGPMKPFADGVITLGGLFAMGLFLFIAGRFTPEALRHRGAAAFARSRLVRFGVPLFAYVLLVMPALEIVIGVTLGEATGDFASRYSDSLREPSSGPMWFVAVLAAFSLALALVAQVVGLRAPRRAPLRLHYLWLAALGIAAASFVVRLVFPIDSGQFLDVHVWQWPQCATMFALGVLSAQRGWLDPVPDRVRRISGASALVVLVTGGALLAALNPSDRSLKGGPHGSALIIDVVEGFYAVGASIWIIGLFQQRFAHQSRFGRWCSRNAFGAFIAQAPVLVGLGLAIEPLDLPADAKFVLLAVLGVTSSFAAAALSRALLRRPRIRFARHARTPT